MTTHVGRNVTAGALLALFTAAAPMSAGAAPAFTITKLVSNQAGVAQNTDPDLVNAWGIAHGPNGPLWVAANGAGLSTIYNPNTGEKLSLTVTIPGGDPTGIAFVPQHSDDNDDFIIHKNGVSGKSIFIFVTESGLIDGWNNSVDLNNAVVAVNMKKQGAVFKGLAVTAPASRLYAADFANNLVRVFDDHFHPIGTFTDAGLPKRFAPFNVKTFDGLVYVNFAKREKNGDDEVDGAGLGYVDVFKANGQLVKRLVSNGPLNAPWGLTIAPPGFGGLDGALLVGNFGDGKINAFDRNTGDFMGTLQGTDGQDLVIDGLWGIQGRFGGVVEFAAGPDDEANGLLGQITAATPAHKSQR